MTNFEKIKTMSLEELAELIDCFRACSRCKKIGNDCFPYFDTEQWLQKEAQE